MQLTYLTVSPIAFNGMIADSGPYDVVTGICEVVAGVPFGIGVVQGTAQDGFIFPTGASTQIKGITLHNHRVDNIALAGTLAVPNLGETPLLRKGRCYVIPEQNVVAGGPVFFRTVANGGLTVLGRLRTDNDGVRKVVTVTPTPANATLYTLHFAINGQTYSVQMTSDANATDIEICDGLRTAILADAVLSTLVTVPAAGAATLVITAVAIGADFTVVDGGSPGVLAVVNTTAASVRAVQIPGARWVTTTTAATLGVVEINLP